MLMTPTEPGEAEMRDDGAASFVGSFSSSPNVSLSEFNIAE
jgi:hypothetical protein